MANPYLEDNDVDLGDPSELNVGGISPARWERARTEPDVRDVMDILHDRRGNPCSCPFHGRDSKPSFNFYPAHNDCSCFGCPDGDNYWDTIKIVARTKDISATSALLWLEREIKLPPLVDDTSTLSSEVIVDLGGAEALDDELEEDDVLALSIEDLRPTYIAHAAEVVSHAGSDSVTVARDLIEQYFLADKHDDPVPLARVLGADVVHRAIALKHARC